MYRRILSSTLLLSIIFSTIGYAVIFSLVSEILHYRNWEKKNAATTNLTFTEAEFKKLHWLEEAKEFKHNNEYYDVISVETNGAVITVQCYHDRHEKNVFAFFSQCIKNTFDDSAMPRGKSKSKFNFKLPDYFLERETEFIACNPFTEYSIERIFPERSGYATIFLKPPIG